MILLSTETVLAAIQSSISANNDAIRAMSTTNTTAESILNNATLNYFIGVVSFIMSPKALSFRKSLRSNCGIFGSVEIELKEYLLIITSDHMI
jgi:hypothetical protein